MAQILNAEDAQIARLKESNKDLAFDLEKTRQWAIAAEEELDVWKAEVNDLVEQINKLNAEVTEAKAEADKAKADLAEANAQVAACQAEKDILIQILNAS